VAKPTPKTAQTGGNRRDRLASFEADRKRDQRRRTAVMVAICAVLALALLAYPVYLFVDDYRMRSATLDDIGAPVSAAGCEPAAENPATGNQEHVADGTKVSYAQTPPDTGAHYNSPAPFTKRFYTMDDRPPVENLVHNLEHGYTVVWYRDTISENEKSLLEQISKTFAGDDYTTDKLIAAPWSEADGAGFPEGKNVVLAHWAADPSDPSDTTKQKGVRQACTLVSGPAVKDFMAKYPSSMAPEPNGS